MPKKKKKESLKERRRRAALQRQRTLEAERIRREKEPKKKGKGWPKGKVLAIVFLIFLVPLAYSVWQSTQPSTESPSPKYLTDIDGVEFSLNDFRGKVVVLDLFSTRCQPCIEQIAHLAEVHEKYSINEVVIISISVDPAYDTVERLRQFREDQQMTWRVARDTIGLSDEYNVELIPTLVILDQNGIVQYGPHAGLTDSLTLSNVIDSLLG